MQHRERSIPPINFRVGLTDLQISKYANISSLTDFYRTDPGLATKISYKADLCWCLQSYLVLKEKSSFSVLCSNKMIESGINFIHSHHLLELRGNSATFIVCVRADYPRRRWAHHHLVQNQSQQSENGTFIPLWPQPGLVARDPRRRGVRSVGYAGQLFGGLAGNADEWKLELDSYDIEFVPLSSGQWHDLSSIDVLVGIRSFDARPHNTKPASKLINAWHAHIPFIGGHDSAFMQIGRPGEDYLLARTPQEAVYAVLRLRDDPELYSRLVRNGIRKAMQYTEQAIYEKWESTILGPIMRRYERWKSSPNFERARFNTMLKVGLLEHQSKQVIKKMIGKSLSAC
jgi:hypothetical protein